MALADGYDHRLIIVDMTGVIDTEELSISEDEVLVAAAWLAVGLPLAWGVYRTLQSVAKFFN